MTEHQSNDPPAILDAEQVPEQPTAIEPITTLGGTVVRTEDELLRVEQQIQLTAEAHRRFRIAALKVTKAADWIDEAGKPWLQAIGVERLVGLFRIRERNVRAEKVDHEGGPYTVLVSGDLVSDVLDPEGWVSSIGARYSHDGFFTRAGKAEPIYGDVLKAAYANWKARAVTGVLGIRGLTWEELGTVGIRREEAGGKVSFFGASSGETVPMRLRVIADKDTFKEAIKEKVKVYPRWDGDAKLWLVPKEAVNVAMQWADTVEEKRGPGNGSGSVSGGGAGNPQGRQQ